MGQGKCSLTYPAAFLTFFPNFLYTQKPQFFFPTLLNTQLLLLALYIDTVTTESWYRCETTYIHIQLQNLRVTLEKNLINTLLIKIYEIQVFYEQKIKAQQHKKFSLPKWGNIIQRICLLPTEVSHSHQTDSHTHNIQTKY